MVSGAASNGVAPRPGDVFDTTGRIPRPPYAALAKEAWSLLTYRPAPPNPADLPHGRNRPVLVLPAVFTGDAATRPLRRFLARCGFRPHPWRLGVNWGPTRALRANLRRRLLDLHAAEAAPIALLGVSMGGLLARDLAHDHPEAVRQVITVASPFRLPTATTLAPVLRPLSRFYDPAVDLARLSRPLPVPAMAIATRDDGVVAWRTCLSDDPASCPNVELTGAHLTLCRDPRTLRAIAARLAEN